MSVGVVILLGTSKNGSHLRPISLDIPVALFPIAGNPIIEYQIDAAVKIDFLTHVFLIGGFGQKLQTIDELIDRMSIIHKNVQFIYLEQDMNQVCGSAGVLYQFRDKIKDSMIKRLFIVNCDVVYRYNFAEMYHHYLHVMNSSTIEDSSDNNLKHCVAVTTVPDDYTHYFGVIVLSQQQSNLVIHYVEKPQSFISNTINCGVFLCDISIFDTIDQLYNEKKQLNEFSDNNTLDLFRAVLPLVVANNECFSFDINSSFVRIKGAGSALFANKMIMEESSYNKKVTVMDSSFVTISPTAKIDPLAVIGPNVSIGDHCTIDAGVRISNAILMDGCIVERNSLIKNAIIGKHNIIEPWSRIEGSQLTTLYDTLVFSNRDSFFNEKGMIQPSPAILGNNVRVKATTAIYNTIIMPHTEISGSRYNEIIL